jgi:DNA-binding NtrC family response regulator
MQKSYLIIDDDLKFAESVVADLSHDALIKHASSANQGMAAIANTQPDVVLLDFNMPEISGLEFLKIIRKRLPDLPIIMLTGESATENIVEAMKAGANDYVIKGSDDFSHNLQFRIQKVLEATALHKRTLGLEIENRKSVELSARLRTKIIHESKTWEILGSSHKILKLRSDLMRLKGSAFYVLIQGENGTGKELVARNLNLQEEDTSRPFIVVNCAAITSTLFESEFFGHMKGSFTGATQDKKGLFQMADGGDIFLDEVGEIPIELQAKLLRALQEKTFTPVGSTKPITVDVRVIAATNRDLKKEVAAKRFREDLYYRLNQATITVPSLRERKEDILELANIFLKRSIPMAKISEPAKELLASSPWHGNIRELESTIALATLHLKNESRPYLKPEHLTISTEERLRQGEYRIPDDLMPKSTDEVSKTSFEQLIGWSEKMFLERALKLFGGDNQAVYKALGVSKSYFFNKKKDLNIRDDEMDRQL